LEQQCPICKGAGRAISQRHFNRVSGGTPTEQVCWLCDGKGIIVKEETKHQLMHKYWLTGDKNGEKES